MAKRYTSTVQLRCTKQHTCSSCGCVYSYIMERKVVGTGPTADKASANMKANYVKTQRDENDMHPCPNCGQYQQDMIGLRLARKRKIVAISAVVMPILVPILRGSYAVQANTLTWVVVFYCAAALVVQYLLGLKNPNSDREANRGVAADRVVKGTMLIQPMETTPNPDTGALPRPTQSLVHVVMLALLAGAIVLGALPEGVRAVSGWPLNEECYPPVVGPADTTRVYMTESITSIKGYWRGTPHVILQTAGNVDAAPLRANTNQNDWGSTIYAKSDEKTTSSHPWVEFTLPESADLSGKIVTCHVDLNMEFPAMSGGDSFTTIERQMRRDVSVHLASAGAGGQYNTIWWSSTMAALLVIFVGSVVLVYVARGYQRKANPAQVFPVQQA